MKIGIDARMYRSSMAGIGRYSQNLIKNLLAIDHDDQFIFFMTKEDAKEFKIQISRRRQAIKCKMTVQNAKIVITNIPHYSLAEQIKLAKIIEAEKCDLVHFLHFNVPINYKGKFMVTIHDLTLLFYPDTAKRTNFFKQWAFRYVIKNACQKSFKIIAVSESTKKDIIKTFRIEADKIKVIPEAADDKAFTNPPLKLLDQLKDKYQLQNKKVILYVGQFRRHKNIPGLITAFKIVKKKIPSKLILLGRILEKDLIDNQELLRDIVIPGFVSDQELAAWYKIADCFVFPSFYEGFGLPGLEAMMAELPVVAANRASLPEIFKDGALYFNPFKIQDIADKIRMVLEDKKLRISLIKKGKIVAGKYSWEKTAEETLKIYEASANLKMQNSK